MSYEAPSSRAVFYNWELGWVLILLSYDDGDGDGYLVKQSSVISMGNGIITLVLIIMISIIY